MPERRFENALVSAGRRATGLRALRSLAAATALLGLAACSAADGLTPSFSTASTSGTPRFPSSIPASPTPIRMNGTAARRGTMPSTAPTSRNTRPRSTGIRRKASGVSFAFIKATEGGDRIDSYFDEHWSKTKAAGVPRAPITSTISAGPPPSRRAGTSRTCPTTAPPAARARHGMEPEFADLQAAARPRRPCAAR